MERDPQVENNDSKLVDRCRSKPQILSLNEIYPENGSQCSYCHKSNGSFSWSFTKAKMQPYTYELMIERGWRRCGTYYYKPNLFKSCCKLFTHRLEVAKFHPRKDQRKALKKVISLAYEHVESKQIKQTHKIIQQKANKQKEKQQKPAKITQEISQLIKTVLQKICMQLVSYLQGNLFALLKNSGITEICFSQFNFQLGNKLKFFVSKPGQKWNYYSNFVMLLFGLNKKLFSESKYGLLDFSKDIKTGIEGVGIIQGYQIEVERGGYLLFKIIENVQVDKMQIQVKHKQIKINQKIDKQQDINPSLPKQIMRQIKPNKNPFHPSMEIEPRGQRVPQTKHQQKHVIKDQPLVNGLQFKGEINITSKRITFGKIIIDIVPAEQNEQSFKLYQKYTKQIHEKKEKAMSSYVNFLCLQSLNFRTEHSTIPEQHRQKYIPSWDPSQKYQHAKSITGDINKPLGCYHMKYWFEERLIAVGVVDIVDYGFSSVYFFYDPAFKDYRLGVFSSIIEIQYVRWLQLSFPEFRYYYMGFYIANNQKMNYKNDYMPCSLLCPQTYLFVEFDERIKEKTAKIAEGKQKNVRLSVEGLKKIDDMQFGSNIGPIIDSGLKLTYNNRRIVLKQINPAFFVHVLKIMKENLPVWGKKLFDILTFTV